MSDIVPALGAALEGRRARSTARALAQIDANCDIQIALVEAKADVQAAKVSAIGYVAKRALIEVAGLSSVEQRLSAIDPSSMGRYQSIVDIAAIESAAVVSETARKVNR